MMGGSISVTSRLGVGSTFQFTARLALQTTPVRQIVSETNFEAQRPAPASANGRHALVVEDNAINLMVAVGLLENLGWKVTSARDGKEALAAHERDRFDVIFMDCQMPVMDGFAATTRIREREQAGTPRTPIIALTASIDDSYRTRCREVGMDEFVAKPFTRQTIEAAMMAVMA